MLTAKRNYVIFLNKMVGEQIAHLRELQNYDLKILALKNRINVLPSEAEQIQQEAGEKKKEIEEKKKKVQDVELARRKLELELQEKEEKVKKFQSQLNKAKNNKEYSAFLQEIEEIKKESSVQESKILEMMSEQDTLILKEKKEQGLFKEAEEKLSVEKKKVTAEMETLKSQLEEEEGKRNVLAKNIDKSALSLYEKIRKTKKNGLVMAQLNNGICSGCFMKLPSAVAEKVKKGNDFVLCDHCSRILYL